jgi:mono/diheme cytochrome c family protein
MERRLTFPLVALTLALSAPIAAADNVAALYGEHCAPCHHPKRLGLTAPPLIPDTLKDRSADWIRKTITEGALATRMPAFSGKLSEAQVSELAGFIMTPAGALEWTFGDIKASMEERPDGSSKKELPKGIALEDITLVMAKGDRSLFVLAPGSFENLAQFHVGPVHGGPKFTHALDAVYAVARDGGLTKFDLRSLAVDARAKAGISSRSVAVSGDDKIIGVANYLPQNIVFFDPSLNPVKEIKVDGKTGGFYALPIERKFIVSFRDKPELWLIGDHEPFEVEKLPLPEPFEDFSISPAGPVVLGTKRGSGVIHVYDYKQRKTLTALASGGGMPHLASATFWMKGGELFVAVNHIGKPLATVYSLDKLKAVAEITLPGSGFFIRAHKGAPQIWVDSETEKIVLISKEDLSKVSFLVPRPGRKASHIEFSADGKSAFISIPGVGGEVVIYDTATLKEVKSIPFNDPAGKYNATNKTHPSRTDDFALSGEKISAGEDVFKKFCMGCHHQVYEAFGPSFTEIAAMRTEDQIRYHLQSPVESAQALGYRINSMPRLPLSGEQLDAVVSYVSGFR